MTLLTSAALTSSEWGSMTPNVSRGHVSGALGLAAKKSSGKALQRRNYDRVKRRRLDGRESRGDTCVLRKCSFQFNQCQIYDARAFPSDFHSQTAQSRSIPSGPSFPEHPQPQGLRCLTVKFKMLQNIGAFCLLTPLHNGRSLCNCLSRL